jgi:hypothetical protein
MMNYNEKMKKELRIGILVYEKNGAICALQLRKKKKN